jgi:hypothetical protein
MKVVLLNQRTVKALMVGALLACAIGGTQAAIVTITSGSTFFKRVITNTSVLLLSTTAATSTTFANVPGTQTTVFVPANSSVLISVDFNAEARCSGGNVGTATVAADPNWCELTALIGGTEGNPQASTTSLGDTYSFVSTDNGRASFASWAGHAMSRHRCVTNTTNAPLAVPVAMQWKIVSFSPATAPATEFWLDDSAMVVQMSSGCTATSVADGPVNGVTAPTPAQVPNK